LNVTRLTALFCHKIAIVINSLPASRNILNNALQYNIDYPTFNNDHFFGWFTFQVFLYCGVG
jgi:hypothetical protein